MVLIILVVSLQTCLEKAGLNKFINRGFAPYIVKQLWQLKLDCKDTVKKEMLFTT